MVSRPGGSGRGLGMPVCRSLPVTRLAAAISPNGPYLAAAGTPAPRRGSGSLRGSLMRNHAT